MIASGEHGADEPLAVTLANTTPGPWFVEAHGIMDRTRGRTICLFGDSEQDQADAALVAAAPTLWRQVMQLRRAVAEARTLMQSVFGHADYERTLAACASALQLLDEQVQTGGPDQ